MLKIRISGLPLTDENIFTININKGVFPSNTVSIDDLENCINGTNDQMEWTLDPNSANSITTYEGLYAPPKPELVAPCHDVFISPSSILSLFPPLVADTSVTFKPVLEKGNRNRRISNWKS